MTLDLFPAIPKAPTKEQYVEGGREWARQFAAEHGEVTADDAHQFYPPPKDVDPRVIAALFQGLVWVGFTKSRRATCHHRHISRFTIAREV